MKKSFLAYTGIFVVLFFFAANNAHAVDGIKVDSNGNIGIGTSTPQSKMDVEGGVAIGATYSGTTAAPTNGMIIEGNVGIGTASPGAKLHLLLSGTAISASANTVAAFQRSSSGNNAGLSLIAATDSNSIFKFGDPDDEDIGRIDYDHANNNMAIYTNNTEAIRINSSGNVKIGTGTPEAKLDVAGNVKFTGKLAINYTNPTATLHIVSPSGNMAFIHNNSWSGVYLTNGATSWTPQSDIRLKNVLGNIENSLEKISKIKPVYYKYKKDDEKRMRRVGVIAQDVQKVFPEVVNTNEDNGYLGVAYPELVTLLIGGIQEQQQQIKELKAEKQTLTQSIKDLRAETRVIKHLIVENETLKAGMEALMSRIEALESNKMLQSRLSILRENQ